jgi:hypothetical protein
MRYPEDLFKVQRFQLARYHVTNPNTFYEDTERWEVPQDPSSRSQLQPPYRLSVRSGGDGQSVFSLTSTYVPYQKDNLASFVSVDADASKDSYGTIRILELPTSSRVDGPGQVANAFATDQDIADKLLRFNLNNVRKVYGNLLTLPVGDSFLYVQPLYTQREGAEGSGNFPVLNFVLVSFGGKLAIDTTMSGAIAQVLGAEAPEPGAGNGNGNGGTVTVSQEVLDLLEQADAEFKDANEALAAGDLATYDEHYDKAQRLVERALEAAQDLPDQKPPAEEEKPTQQPSESGGG